MYIKTNHNIETILTLYLTYIMYYLETQEQCICFWKLKHASNQVGFSALMYPAGKKWE